MVCEKKRNEHYKEIARRLDGVRDSSEWWDLVNEMRARNVSLRSGISVNEFAEYFATQLTAEGSMILYLYEYAEPMVSDDILDREISMNELMTVVNGLKDKKTPGEDGVPVEFFKYAPVEYLEGLLKVFMDMHGRMKVDESFNRAVLYPILKKGSREDVCNYRGISFCSSVGKIFASVMNKRLDEWVSVNGRLNEYQAGFRKGYSTVDNVFSLVCMVNIKWYEGCKKVYLFFVDFKAAFDRVNRSALIYKLSQCGLSSRFLNVIRSMYEGTSAIVWDGNRISEVFDTNVGVRQGCVMSPLLFALFLNDLHESLSGGLDIDGKCIRVLMYADDIVLMAESPERLQVMMEDLERYCKTWGLVVNLAKSQVMIMKEGGGRIGRNEKWIFNGEDVKVVKEYKYLGMNVVPSLGWRHNLKERVDAAKGNVNMMWNVYMNRTEVGFCDKLKLFYAVGRSIVCYGCQVWGASMYAELERLKTWFVKKTLGLPRCAPDYVIWLETGVLPVYLYTLGCNVKYVRKVLFAMDENRLPNFLASGMISRGIGWMNEWNRICGRHGIVCNLNVGMDAFDRMTGTMMNTEREWLMYEQINRARGGSRHGLYNELQYMNGTVYMERGWTVHKIGMIVKVRAGLLNLNGNEWRMNERRLCSLCNRKEEESVFHFLCICPVLGDVRRRHLGVRVIDMERCLDLLNGSQWDILYSYVCQAMSVRKCLVSEFNF